jgi:sugar phosphate isomerase/epimerase
MPEACTAPAAAPARGTNAKLKLGCLSWCFHTFKPGTDPAEAIDTIGRLGFDGVELILLARDDIRNFWTLEKVGALRRQLDQQRLTVSQFVIFQPVVEGLSSVDANIREQNLDYFEAGCRIAKSLNAPILNIVAPWARELSGPTAYLPRFYEIEHPKPGEKFRIDVASGFDWARSWEAYVASTKACLERVKAHGLRLSIEHHTHCMIPDAPSFQLLWNEIRDPALGYNLDTGWTLAQREYPPVAIHKLREHIINLHVRDIDGLMRAFPPFGEGVMDFQAVIDSLKHVGFNGFLSIEQDKGAFDMHATCKRYLQIMRELIG